MRTVFNIFDTCINFISQKEYNRGAGITKIAERS